MTTYEFIEANLGKQVYLDGGGDLGMDGKVKHFIQNKTPLTLVKLTKKKLAYVTDGNEFYSVPASNINLI